MQGTTSFQFILAKKRELISKKEPEPTRAMPNGIFNLFMVSMVSCSSKSRLEMSYHQQQCLVSYFFSAMCRHQIEKADIVANKEMKKKNYSSYAATFHSETRAV